MLEKIKSLLTLDNLFNIIYFVVGIIIGIIIIILIFKLLANISKKQTYKTTKPITPVSNPSDVYQNILDEYDLIDPNLPLSTRLNLIKDLLLKLVTDVSKCYYPNKKNALYEIDLKTALTFLNDIVNEIEELVDKILANPAFKLVWGASTTFINVKNKIKKIFNKNYEPSITLPKEVKSLNISEVYSMLENNKKSSDSKKSLKILNNFINNEVHKLIDKVYQESVLIYSNNYMTSEALTNVNN